MDGSYMKAFSRQVKVRDMHMMMMLGICKFHENQYKKDSIFLMDIHMRLQLQVYHETVWHFESKEQINKSVCMQSLLYA